mgnify:CR=1 FL=1
MPRFTRFPFVRNWEIYNVRNMVNIGIIILMMSKVKVLYIYKRLKHRSKSIRCRPILGQCQFYIFEILLKDSLHLLKRSSFYHPFVFLSISAGLGLVIGVVVSSLVLLGVTITLVCCSIRVYRTHKLKSQSSSSSEWVSSTITLFICWIKISCTNNDDYSNKHDDDDDDDYYDYCYDDWDDDGD